MSDEKRQFRKLFSDDKPQHEELRESNIAVDSPDARGPDGKPDNWLVGRQWLLYGYNLVDSGVKIRNQTPINFYQTGPKWRIKHAEAIESEGVLDDRAKSAWQQGADDWQSFGQRSVPTTSPFTIKLGSILELDQQRQALTKQLMDLAGETYRAEEKLLRDGLNDQEREALAVPPEERNQEQGMLAMQLEVRLKPMWSRVARKAPENVRLRAIQLAAELADVEARYQKTDSYRGQVNYEYWQTLCTAEQEDRTVEARRLLFDAEKANADADIDQAIQKYEQAFAMWAEIIDDFPVLLQDELSDDLMRSINRYKVAIDREDFDDDFPLHPFIEVMLSEKKTSEEYRRLRQLQKEGKLERRATPTENPGEPTSSEAGDKNDVPEKSDEDTPEAKDGEPSAVLQPVP